MEKLSSDMFLSSPGSRPFYLSDLTSIATLGMASPPIHPAALYHWAKIWKQSTGGSAFDLNSTLALSPLSPVQSAPLALTTAGMSSNKKLSSSAFCPVSPKSIQDYYHHHSAASIQDLTLVKMQQLLRSPPYMCGSNNLTISVPQGSGSLPSPNDPMHSRPMSPENGLDLTVKAEVGTKLSPAQAVYNNASEGGGTTVLSASRKRPLQQTPEQQKSTHRKLSLLKSEKLEVIFRFIFIRIHTGRM